MLILASVAANRWLRSTTKSTTGPAISTASWFPLDRARDTRARAFSTYTWVGLAVCDLVVGVSPDGKHVIRGKRPPLRQDQQHPKRQQQTRHLAVSRTVERSANASSMLMTSMSRTGSTESCT